MVIIYEDIGNFYIFFIYFMELTKLKKLKGDLFHTPEDAVVTKA